MWCHWLAASGAELCVLNVELGGKLKNLNSRPRLCYSLWRFYWEIFLPLVSLEGRVTMMQQFNFNGNRMLVPSFRFVHLEHLCFPGGFLPPFNTTYAKLWDSPHRHTWVWLVYRWANALVPRETPMLLILPVDFRWTELAARWNPSTVRR